MHLETKFYSFSVAAKKIGDKDIGRNKLKELLEYHGEFELEKFIELEEQGYYKEEIGRSGISCIRLSDLGINRAKQIINKIKKEYLDYRKNKRNDNEW